MTPLCISAAWAAAPGALRVEVIDDEMELPIPNVEITLTSPALAAPLVLRTDAMGEVLVPDLPSGDTYVVRAEKGGFSRGNAEIEVAPGRTVALHMELHPWEPEEEYGWEERRDGHESPVPDIETRFGSVRFDRVRRIPVGGAMPSLLSTVPGVVLDASGDPQISGGGSDESAYVLLGANVTDPVSGTAPLSVPAAAVRHADLAIGGASPALDAATGGVVEWWPVAGSNDLDLDATFAADPAGGWRRTTATLVGSLPYDGVALALAHESVAVADTFDGHAAFARLDVSPLGHRLSAALLASPATVAPDGAQTQGGFVSVGRWSWWTGHLSGETSASAQRTTLTADGVRDARLSATARTSVFLYDLREPTGGYHDVSFGVQGSHAAWVWTTPEGREPQGTAGKLAGYVQDAWTPVGGLRVSYGCRVDLFQIRDAAGATVASGVAPEPRVYAGWYGNGEGRTKVVVGYGRVADTGRLAWVLDAARERAPVMDEAILDVERAVAWELVLSTALTARRTRGLLDGEARDYLRWDLGIQKIYFRGWELDARYSLTPTGSTARAFVSLDLPTEPWMQSITLAALYTDEEPLASVDVARAVAPGPFFGLGENGFVGATLQQYVPLPDGRAEIALQVTSPLRAPLGAASMFGPPGVSLGVRVQH